jgi:KDO2-lipid IV(A) lauroyltransferase
MGRRPTLKHRLEFAGLYVVYVLGRLLPRRTFVGLGAWLGRLVFDILGILRDVTLGNLRATFEGERTEAEILDLARRSYGQLGGSLLEFASLPGMNRRELIECVEFEGLEHIDRVREGGCGAMLVTGHFGSWELFGASFVARGYDTTFFVKRQKNPLVADLQDEIRRRAGIEIVTEGPAVAKGVLRALRRGHLVGILPDQDARRHGVFVEFLGRPASTYKGPAYFAYRAKVPIVPAYVRRTEDGNHIGTVLEPIYPRPDAEPEREIFRLTQAYTDRMSEWIRRFPEHYFWVHRRWKTVPEGPIPFLEEYRLRERNPQDGLAGPELGSSAG